MRKAIVPLAVALSGALVVFLMFAWSQPLILALPLVATALAYGALRYGRQKAAKDPNGSIMWFELGGWLPYALGAFISAVLILFAVWLAPPEEAKNAAAATGANGSLTPSPTPAAPGPTQSPLVDQLKQPKVFKDLAGIMGPYFAEGIKAVSGAIGAFLTLLFLKPAEDGDAWVGARVESAFNKEFSEKVKRTAADDAVNDPDWGDSGWGHDMRRKRADKVAEVLNLPRRQGPTQG